MIRIKTLSIAALLLSSSMAHAQIIDFVDLTENTTTGIGESAWTTLNLSYTDFNVAITGTKFGEQAFAYLDWNHAGLGVCGDVYSNTADDANTGSGENICNPGSDDNVTTGEGLFFVFDIDVIIEKLWLNNTHDPDRDIFGDGTTTNPDAIWINGVSYDGPGNGYATNNYTGYGSSVDNFLGSFFVAANTAFSVAFLNQQFYVSGMQVTAVPEPGTLGLLVMGLFGLAFARRNRRT